MGSGADGLRCTVRRTGGRVVVALAGELDLAGADQFVATAREALAEGPVLLDLSGLTFMDSSGLRALDTILGDGAQEDRSLAVAPELQDPVRQVLELTGMDAMLPVEGS